VVVLAGVAAVFAAAATGLRWSPLVQAGTEPTGAQAPLGYLALSKRQELRWLTRIAAAQRPRVRWRRLSRAAPLSQCFSTVSHGVSDTKVAAVTRMVDTLTVHVANYPASDRRRDVRQTSTTYVVAHGCSIRLRAVGADSRARRRACSSLSGSFGSRTTASSSSTSGAYRSKKSTSRAARGRVADAISTMVVRGSAGDRCWQPPTGSRLPRLHGENMEAADRVLRASRPTAVNLAWALDRCVTTRRTSTLAASTPTRSSAAAAWPLTPPTCLRPVRVR